MACMVNGKNAVKMIINKNRKYDPKIIHLHTADQPTASQRRALNTNSHKVLGITFKVKQTALSLSLFSLSLSLSLSLITMLERTQNIEQQNNDKHRTPWILILYRACSFRSFTMTGIVYVVMISLSEMGRLIALLV